MNILHMIAFISTAEKRGEGDEIFIAKTATHLLIQPHEQFAVQTAQMSRFCRDDTTRVVCACPLEGTWESS